MISIYNDGPRAPADWRSKSGIGLRNTAERLSLLYGDGSHLELANVRNGVRVVVQLPLREQAPTPALPQQTHTIPAHPVTIM